MFGMRRLTTTPTAFEARVLAARLDAEGILSIVRGEVEGPYPVTPIEVLVGEDDWELACEVLLAAEVDAAMEPVSGRAPISVWLVIGVIIVAGLFVLGRAALSFS